MSVSVEWLSKKIHIINTYMWEIHADSIVMPLVPLVDLWNFPSPLSRLEDLHVRGILCLTAQQENQFISMHENWVMMTVHVYKYRIQLKSAHQKHG